MTPPFAASVFQKVCKNLVPVGLAVVLPFLVATHAFGQFTHQVVRHFESAINGAAIRAPLVRLDGFSGTGYFGTTSEGGEYGLGTVFRIDAVTGEQTTVYHFRGGAFDGANPYGGLVTDGSALYGTSYAGGSANLGVIFRLSLRNLDDQWTLSLRYSFPGGLQGARPVTQLVRTPDGSLYGTCLLYTSPSPRD